MRIQAPRATLMSMKLSRGIKMKNKSIIMIIFIVLIINNLSISSTSNKKWSFYGKVQNKNFENIEGVIINVFIYDRTNGEDYIYKYSTNTEKKGCFKLKNLSDNQLYMLELVKNGYITKRIGPLIPLYQNTEKNPHIIILFKKNPN